MVNGSRKNKVNNPSHPSRTYMDLLGIYVWRVGSICLAYWIYMSNTHGIYLL